MASCVIVKLDMCKIYGQPRRQVAVILANPVEYAQDLNAL
jgi:hypothetical protein